MDVVDAEDVSAAQGGCGDGADSACVAEAGFGLVEDFAEEAFAGDGEQDGATEGLEDVEVSADGGVVGGLFGEAQAGVEEELLGGEAGGEELRDALAEEVGEGGEDVGVGDVGVALLGEADGVHEEVRGAGAGAEGGDVGGGGAANVVEELAAVLEGEGGDFGAPGIDGEDRGRDLDGVARDEGGGGEGVPKLEKAFEAADFFGGGDGGAVGAGAFGAEVEDVGAGSDVLACKRKGSVGVEGSVAGKRVIVEVEDAHNKRAPRENDRSCGEAQQHGGSYAVCSASQRSASMAAAQPIPAAVIACR